MLHFSSCGHVSAKSQEATQATIKASTTTGSDDSSRPHFTRLRVNIEMALNGPQSVLFLLQNSKTRFQPHFFSLESHQCPGWVFFSQTLKVTNLILISIEARLKSSCGDDDEVLIMLWNSIKTIGCWCYESAFCCVNNGTKRPERVAAVLSTI